MLGSLLVSGALAPTSAFAQSASVTVTGGGVLGFKVAPSNIAFPAATVGGSSVTVAQSLPLDISDNTASGSGWNVTISSTAMTAGGHTLPMAAIPSAPAAETCDGGPGACGPATTNVSYPHTLSGSATPVVNAIPATGMGDGTVTLGFQQVVPGNAYAGAYSATWTITLNSGP